MQTPLLHCLIHLILRLGTNRINPHLLSLELLIELVELYEVALQQETAEFNVDRTKAKFIVSSVLTEKSSANHIKHTFKHLNPLSISCLYSSGQLQKYQMLALINRR